MSQHTPTLSASLSALRKEFDDGFTDTPIENAGKLEKLLAIRIADGHYAIRVADIGGLYVDRRIMPLPSPVAALLGMAGFRGQIAAVYDLAALFGYQRQTPPRWMVLSREREPVALAFDAFEAHLAVPMQQISLSNGTGTVLQDASRMYVDDVVRTDQVLYPIINLPSLLEDIRRQGQSPNRHGAINHE